MKKTYIEPYMQMVFTATQSMICLSNGGVTSGNGIGYGGVDEEGKEEPAARRHNDMWDDESEDEEL